jgi:modification methylase
VQGLDACNGWTFWHTESQGKRVPIDEVRKVARTALGLAA